MYGTFSVLARGQHMYGTFPVFARGATYAWYIYCFDIGLARWRQANVTLIPKGPSSSSVANY